MNTEKKIILFGAGAIGRLALRYFGADRVHCFADNVKYGQEHSGKPIISFDKLKEIVAEYDIVIAAHITNTREILAQLRNAGIEASIFEEHIDINNLKSNPEIVKLHNIHNGKRCFLIGNGPSLRSKDLDKLHINKEIAFGCNFIYKIFPHTLWRPNYYVAVDYNFLFSHIKEIATVEAEIKFIPHSEMFITKDNEKVVRDALKNSNFCHIYRVDILPNNYYFSNDPSKIITTTGGVMNAMTQLAAYMGFKEIYLIGVDGLKVSMADDEYDNEKRHFHEEASVQEQRKIYTLTTSRSSEDLQLGVKAGFQVAEDYSRKHGFRIYNATRGGTVETFERVDFDSLFI